MLTFEIGTKGQTSVAPILGCSPLCLFISISSILFLIPKKADFITSSGGPTIVTTVLLVSFPISTSKSVTPDIDSIEVVISFIIFGFLPSLKFGTHSIIFIYNLIVYLLKLQ